MEQHAAAFAADFLDGAQCGICYSSLDDRPVGMMDRCHHPLYCYHCLLGEITQRHQVGASLCCLYCRTPSRRLLCIERLGEYGSWRDAADAGRAALPSPNIYTPTQLYELPTCYDSSPVYGARATPRVFPPPPRPAHLSYAEFLEDIPCGECKTTMDEESNPMLLCDGCDAGRHLECMLPGQDPYANILYCHDCLLEVCIVCGDPPDKGELMVRCSEVGCRRLVHWDCFEPCALERKPAVRWPCPTCALDPSVRKPMRGGGRKTSWFNGVSQQNDGRWRVSACARDGKTHVIADITYEVEAAEAHDGLLFKLLAGYELLWGYVKKRLNFVFTETEMEAKVRENQ